MCKRVDVNRVNIDVWRVDAVDLPNTSKMPEKGRFSRPYTRMQVKKVKNYILLNSLYIDYMSKMNAQIPNYSIFGGLGANQGRKM